MGLVGAYGVVTWFVGRKGLRRSKVCRRSDKSCVARSEQQFAQEIERLLGACSDDDVLGDVERRVRSRNAQSILAAARNPGSPNVVKLLLHCPR
jgi:hypothetical protein